MLTIDDISKLARANLRVDATRAAIIAQAACAEYLPPRCDLLAMLKKRTQEQLDTYSAIYGRAEERGKANRLAITKAETNK